MTAFSLGTLLSTVLCVVLGALVYTRDSSSRINRAFALLTMTVAYWVFIEFGLCQSRDYEEALVWRRLIGGWSLACAAMVHFSLVFSGRYYSTRKIWVYLFIYLPALFFFVFDAVTMQLLGLPIQMYWGWTYDVVENNIIADVSLFWQLGCCALPLYLVTKHYISLNNATERNRARLFLASMALTISIVIVEWIFFLLHVRFPPVAASSIAVTSVIIGYAIWKYSLFSLTPRTTSESIVSTMTEVLLLVGPEGNIVFSNNAAQKLLGYSQGELEALSVDKVFPDTATRPEWLTNGKNNVKGESSKLNLSETILLTKSGSPIPISLTGSVLVDKDNTLQGGLLIARDNSGQKQAEQALEESEKQFRLLESSISDVFWTMTLDLETTYVSPSIERQRGFTVDEFNALELEETLTSDSVEIVRKIMADALSDIEANSKTARKTLGLELEAKRKNGSTCWIEFTIHFLKDAQGRPKGIAGVSRDITKRKHILLEKELFEEKFIQSQKMEAIGRLAGGVAHDMNNVLTAIMGSASLLVIDTDINNEQREDIDTILSACSRGRDLTQDLLGFARKGKYVKEVVSLNQVVCRVKDLLKRTLPKKIDVALQLDENIKKIEGDPGQLEHALMNVCINAADAMSDDGILTIKSANIRSIESPEIFGTGADLGDYVEVKVIDTGVGIDQDCLKQVFEPFYTTKPKGKGTGLGLSMVYGTAVNHGGTVNIESTPGKGTTVTILIPAVDKEIEDIPTAGPINRSFPKSTGDIILVVDDEAQIRNVARRLLENLGYTVLQADGGEKAVQIYKEKKDQIALVLLDIIMPGMDGTETFYALRKHNPEAKIILCSGYSRDEKVNKLLVDGAVSFVPKPFSLGVLSEEILTVTG